jgi:hypothetical protein
MQTILSLFALAPVVLKVLIVTFGAVGVFCTTVAGGLSLIPKARPFASGMLAFGADVVKLSERVKALAVRLGIIVASLLLIVGCSMSLERSRADGIARRSAGGEVFGSDKDGNKITHSLSPAKAATRDECAALDKTQRYFGYGAYATGPIAPLAAGIGVVPGISEGAQDAALITAGIAAAVTVFEFAEQQNFAGQWVTQGCGQ